MGKNRFINDNYVRVELEGGDWIEVKEQLTFEEYSSLFVNFNAEDENSNIKLAIPLMVTVIKNWNFKDNKDNEIPCNKENIEKLDAMTVMEILPKITGFYNPEKKN